MAEGLKENVLSFNELQEDIIKAYNDRILPGFVCPSCKTNSGVILLDGFISPVLQSTFGGNIALSGKVVPQVGFVCKHCGNIQYYAYKALVSNGNENVG